MIESKGILLTVGYLPPKKRKISFLTITGKNLEEAINKFSEKLFNMGGKIKWAYYSDCTLKDEIYFVEFFAKKTELKLDLISLINQNPGFKFLEITK